MKLSDLKPGMHVAFYGGFGRPVLGDEAAYEVIVKDGPFKESWVRDSETMVHHKVLEKHHGSLWLIEPVDGGNYPTGEHHVESKLLVGTWEDHVRVRATRRAIREQNEVAHQRKVDEAEAVTKHINTQLAKLGIDAEVKVRPGMAVVVQLAWLVPLLDRAVEEEIKL